MSAASDSGSRSALFRSAEIRRALRLPADPGGSERDYTGVAIDSRQVQPGDLFVALRGERHDGADFVPQAAEGGAAGAVVPEGRPWTDLEIESFPVPDPLAALGSLAAYRRSHTTARVIGITGSSGKTTVREMIACALAPRFTIYRTAGNLNSRVGLPLSIFEAPLEADLWVLELGASEPGEIGTLTEIVAPHDAVVTTVGAAHLEAFGDETAVLAEKLLLVGGADPEGFVVVGERPPELARATLRLRGDAIVAGIGPGANFAPERYDLRADRSWFVRKGVRFELEAGGLHLLRDALIASAVAEALGVDPESAARGLAEFRSLGMRSALCQFGDLTVVADCYNANPESFAAAIDYCASAFPDRRLTAVVGTMLELGEAAEVAHLDVTRRLVDGGFALVAATGDFEAAARRLERSSNGTRFLRAAEPPDIWERLVEELEGDEVVLVKGSRGVRLERIVERLERRFGVAQPGAAGDEE